VGSSTEYNNLVAEIVFPGRAGLIVSQERGDGIFEVSLHSFMPDQQSDFDFSRKVEAAAVPVSQLVEALSEATSELQRLARRK
jgi:hypothetical protein